MRNAARKKSFQPFSALAIDNRFGRYGPEETHPTRAVQVNRDKAMDGLAELYRKLPPTKLYPLLKNHGYSAAEVERFSLAIELFRAESDFRDKAGHFLSALINTGKDADYVVHTAHMDAPINFLGTYNTKKILVKGNAGDHLGDHMQCGEIIVDGRSHVRGKNHHRRRCWNSLRQRVPRPLGLQPTRS